MKTYLITSNYQYEIKADDEQHAIETWHETIENELAQENETLATKMADSMTAKEKITQEQ